MIVELAATMAVLGAIILWVVGGLVWWAYKRFKKEIE